MAAGEAAGWAAPSQRVLAAYLGAMRLLFLLLPLAWAIAALQAQIPAIQQMVDGVNADSLVHCLERLSGEVPVDLGEGDVLITSRYSGHPDHALARQWLKQELERQGYPVSEQAFFQPAGAGINLVAEKPGITAPWQRVYISAHYDSRPGVGPAPGADDDGSGVCAVLEAARVMAAHDLERTVVFALWDQEEQGLVGSGYHASEAAALDLDITGVVHMDMIGYDGDGDGLMQLHVRAVANGIAISDTASLVNARYGLALPMQVELPGLGGSDHASFWAEGYGAILLTEDFGNDFNPYYHTADDRLGHLDTAYWRGNAQLAIGITATLASPMTGVGVSMPQARQPGVLLLPNPAQGSVEVRMGSPIANDAELILLDALGRQVQRWAPPARRMRIDLANLAPGTYFVRLEQGAATDTERLVVLP